MAPARRILEATTAQTAAVVSTATGPQELATAARRAGAAAVLFRRQASAGSVPAGATLVGTDPSVAALALGLAEPGIGVIIETVAGDDEPYNLARRILSIDHLTSGRAGVLLTVDRDDTAGRAAAVDEARLLRELWNSWPLDAIVGDPEAGVFADTDRIRRVDHRGAFDVTGPLGTPSSPQGEPVLLWGGDDAPDDADLALTELELVRQPSAGEEGRPVPAVPSPLRDLLGLERRRLDTATWAHAFAPAAGLGR